MSGNHSTAGCGIQFLLAILLAASVALNIALLSGCSSCVCKGCGVFNALHGRRCECEAKVTSSRKTVYDATDDLREIASRLGLEVQESGACELAVAIKMKFDADSERFPKDVLSSAQFEIIKHRVPDDTVPILAEYQKFIKAMEGKRFVIIP